MTTCLSCNQSRAKTLPCGHSYHLKCLPDRTTCVTCRPINNNLVHRHNSKASRFNPFSFQKSFGKDTTKKATIAKNGNLFLTINQKDQYGRTTITREIKHQHVHQFKHLLNNEATSVQPKEPSRIIDLTDDSGSTATPLICYPSQNKALVPKQNGSKFPHQRQLFPLSQQNQSLPQNNLAMMFFSMLG